jgi:DNA-binding NtrC family response regulator
MAAVLTSLPSVFDAPDSESGIRLLEPRARVLSVSANEADHAALGRFIDGRRWQFRRAHTCGEAIRELSCRGARVVFCEMALPDGNWKDVLESIRGVRHPPRFAVTSPHADERLWFDLLDLGGYDVLSKPLVEEEVRNMLRPAAAPVPDRLRRARLAVVHRR